LESEERLRSDKRERGEGEREGKEQEEEEEDIQDKDDMFTRYIPLASIWAIASRSRSNFNRLFISFPFISKIR
jgi:hypothetical protein